MAIPNEGSINYKDMTDESIISQIKMGDHNALNYIMDKYSELVNTLLFVQKEEILYKKD